MLHDLQATIEHEQETSEEGLDNDMPLNSGVEEERRIYFRNY